MKSEWYWRSLDGYMMNLNCICLGFGIFVLFCVQRKYGFWHLHCHHRMGFWIPVLLGVILLRFLGLNQGVILFFLYVGPTWMWERDCVRNCVRIIVFLAILFWLTLVVTKRIGCISFLWKQISCNKIQASNLAAKIVLNLHDFNKSWMISLH